MKNLINRFRKAVNDQVVQVNYLERLDKKISNETVAQKNLYFHYQFLMKQGLPLPNLSETGFSLYSQDDLDGMLLYIFSVIGMKNKTGVDMAAGLPQNANLTNFFLNWGWTGLLIEGDEGNVKANVDFFKRQRSTIVYPPKCIHAWITAENVNDLISSNGISGEIDLFSLDVDGVDYWLLKNLSVINPRLIVVEYQDILGERDLTVPYKPDFNRFDYDPDFYGASLGAFNKLAKEKGYRLIGSNTYGYNAFFLRNDIAPGIFPEVSIKDCLVHPKVKEGQEQRGKKILEMGWQEV